MKQPIRLVVSDIDGTLVRHDKTMPEANAAAISGLIARGVAVSLISARPPQGMVPLVGALKLSGPLAAFNGGTLWDADGRVLSSAKMPTATVRALLPVFAALGVTRWLFADGRWLTSDLGNPHTARERISSGLEPEQDDMSPLAAAADKLVAVSDDPELLTRVERQARDIAGEQASVVRSQAYYLDVTARSANKGDGVTALARYFRVPLESVAVIGDNANDIAMFRRAGLAIAMGQASAEVRAEADRVAASNEDDGVADAIERFIVPRLG